MLVHEEIKSEVTEPTKLLRWGKAVEYDGITIEMIKIERINEFFNEIWDEDRLSEYRKVGINLLLHKKDTIKIVHRNLKWLGLVTF